MDEDEMICGESYDHNLEVTFEDGEFISWTCQECGAELWEDKADD
jgi:rubrerythrin